MVKQVLRDRPAGMSLRGQLTTLSSRIDAEVADSKTLYQFRDWSLRPAALPFAVLKNC